MNTGKYIEINLSHQTGLHITQANYGGVAKQPSMPLGCCATQAQHVPVLCAPCYGGLLSLYREASAQKELSSLLSLTKVRSANLMFCTQAWRCTFVLFGIHDLQRRRRAGLFIG
eukprot:1859196-Pleurochrysis_carterae.AAC.1